MLETLHVNDTWNKVVVNFISYKSYVDDFLWKCLEPDQKWPTSPKTVLFLHLAEFG